MTVCVLYCDVQWLHCKSLLWTSVSHITVKEILYRVFCLWLTYFAADMSSHLYLLSVLVMLGEKQLLLAAGSKGNRSALPSSTIMIKQVFFLPWYLLLQSLLLISCYWIFLKYFILFSFSLPIAANWKISRSSYRCWPREKRSDKCESRIGKINNGFGVFAWVDIGHFAYINTTSIIQHLLTTRNYSCSWVGLVIIFLTSLWQLGTLFLQLYLQQREM